MLVGWYSQKQNDWLESHGTRAIYYYKPDGSEVLVTEVTHGHSVKPMSVFDDFVCVGEVTEVSSSEENRLRIVQNSRAVLSYFLSEEDYNE